LLLILEMLPTLHYGKKFSMAIFVALPYLVEACHVKMAALNCSEKKAREGWERALPRRYL
jgi:hypothetical protein